MAASGSERTGTTVICFLVNKLVMDFMKRQETYRKQTPDRSTNSWSFAEPEISKQFSELSNCSYTETEKSILYPHVLLL